MLTEALIRVFGLSLTIVIARILGVEKFGLLNFAYALSSICLVISDFGFERLTVREIARRSSRAAKFMSNISAIKVILYMIMAGLCAGIVLWTPFSEKRLFVVLAVFMESAAQQHLLFVCSFFKAVQKMEREALIRSLLAFLLFLSGLGILLAGLGLEGLVVSRVIISLLCLTLGLFWVSKEFKIQLAKVSWRYAKKLMKLSLPLAFYNICVMIYLSINMVILGFIRGNAAVGYYSASHKIIMLILVIPGAISWASLPVLSINWQESFDSFKTTYQKSVRYLLLLAIPIAVGTFLLSKEGIMMLYGKDYLPSVALLCILVLCIIPDYLNHIFAVALISMNRQKTAVLSAIVGAVVAVLTSIIFIPRWGERGAAISFVLAMLSVFLLQFIIVSRDFHLTIPLRIITRTTLAGAAMAVGILLLKKILTALPTLISGSMVIYIGSLLILGEIKTNELKYACLLLYNVTKHKK